MAKWTHDVCLDANDQRRSDEDVSLPLANDAGRIIDFTSALAQILFEPS